MYKSKLSPILEYNDDEEKISILKNIIKLYPETNSLHLFSFKTPIIDTKK